MEPAYYTAVELQPLDLTPDESASLEDIKERKYSRRHGVGSELIEFFRTGGQTTAHNVAECMWGVLNEIGLNTSGFFIVDLFARQVKQSQMLREATLAYMDGAYEGVFDEDMAWKFDIMQEHMKEILEQ